MNPVKKCSVWWWSSSFHLQCYLFTTDIKGTNRTRCPCFGCRDCVRFNIFGTTVGVRNTDMSIIVEKCFTFAPGKWIQDIPGSWIPCHGFRILDTGFRIICQWNLDSRFQIPLVSGIPDSLSCILDSKAQDSWFYKQKFSGSLNPDFLTWGKLYTLFSDIRMLFFRSRMNILFFCRF